MNIFYVSIRTTENYQFDKFRTAGVTGNAIINSQGQGDNPVCSTRHEISQPYRPFSPRVATGSRSYRNVCKNVVYIVFFGHYFHYKAIQHFYFSCTNSLVGWAMCPECPTKDWRRKSCWLNPRESGPEFVQCQGEVTTSQALLGPVLVWSQQNYLKLLLTVT